MRVSIKNLSDFATELNEVQVFHQYNVDIRNREIIVSGEESISGFDSGEPGVDHIMAARLIRNIRLLTNRDKSPILIHMKTCGGDWNEGMAIYDAIKTCPCYVTILNYTHARSMSSLILQAADNRVMMPNSEFMFHHGEYADAGEFITVMNTIEWYKRTMDTMYNIYVNSMKETKHSRWKRASKITIRKWLDEQMDKKNDVYLSAEEAIENGFADSIFEGDWNKLIKC